MPKDSITKSENNNMYGEKSPSSDLIDSDHVCSTSTSDTISNSSSSSSVSSKNNEHGYHCDDKKKIYYMISKKLVLN